MRSGFSILAVAMILGSTNAVAGSLGATGHYGARGVTKLKPGFGAGNGEYQAVEQSFTSNLEFRANDQTSVFTRFTLFPSYQESYLGDQSSPQDCSKSGETLSGKDCEGSHQDPSNPAYSSLLPRVTEAWAQYAFDYCLLQVGRRPRDWGVGMFLNSGHGPFETDGSVFDGVSCDVNVQKSQTLGFSFGYDKLSETGGTADPTSGVGGSFGPYSSTDDLDQYFFTIKYDDRKANAGAPFTRTIGIYFANSTSKKNNKKDPDSPDDAASLAALQTDVKFVDLFLGFYLSDLFSENELLFRLGKSADPSWSRYGGRSSVVNYDSPGKSDIYRNNINAFGLAGKTEYVVSKSGASAGPEEFNTGNLTTHSMFLSYAYAPGDADGYFDDIDPNDETSRLNKRDSAATAMAFHKNYKPTLLLFNDRFGQREMRVDGAYDPERVMNAVVVGLGYDYRSQVNGDFEFRLIGAAQDQGMPESVKSEQRAAAAAASSDDNFQYDVGYAGTMLGYEVDLIYKKSFARDFTVGGSFAYVIPGAAFDVYKGKGKASSMQFEANATMKF
jgi:hypothetical protein